MSATKGPTDETLKTLETAPNMYLILSPDLYILTASDLYLEATKTTREAIKGKYIFDAFPDNPEIADADGVQNINASLQSVLQTRKPDYMRVQRYDVPDANNPGKFIQRYWDPSHTPVLDENGDISYIIQLATNVTDKIMAEQQLVRTRMEQVETTAQMKLLNQELLLANTELREAQHNLHQLNTQLEERVAQRTRELQEAQQRLEEGQIALQLAIGAANFGTWFIHSVTREFITDARLKELFGYYPDEKLSIEQALMQIMDDYRGYVAEKLENAIYNNGDYDVTYPVVGFHDQQLRWLRAIGNLKADPSGAFSAFTGVVMDITEPYLAARKVERAEESLRIATESGELGTWYYEEETGRFESSARFNEIFGLPLDGQPSYPEAFSRIRADHQALVSDAVNASFRQGTSFNVEYAVVAEDNTERWVRSVGKMISDDKGHQYVTGVLADITEQKRDELRKNDFIGMVSHELKTPLTSLTAILQVLQARLRKTEDPFVPDALGRANVQVKKMSSMINGFLNVSRLESGKILIQKQPFIMGDLIREIISESNLTGVSHIIELTTCDKVVVKADREKIGSVLSNLLSNAVKYSPKGSGIQVDCRQLDRKVQVSVRDEGVGIRREDKDYVFDRYYRAESNRSQHISGFGIGLYLSAEIIQHHNGRIWVESESGKGSVFYFALPL